MKCIQFERKKKKNLSLFADLITLHTENLKVFTKILLESVNVFTKFAGYNINSQTSATFFSFFLILFYLTLQYCIGFAIYQNESATGKHVFPILNPPPSPYHPSGSSQCTSPKHPVSCIEPGLVTHLYSLIISYQKGEFV